MVKFECLNLYAQAECIQGGHTGCIKMILMTICRTSSNLYRLEPTQSTLMVSHTNAVYRILHGKSVILPELGGHPFRLVKPTIAAIK